MNTLLIILFFATQPPDFGIAEAGINEDKQACYAYCDRGLCSGVCFPAKGEKNGSL